MYEYAHLANEVSCIVSNSTYMYYVLCYNLLYSYLTTINKYNMCHALYVVHSLYMRLVQTVQLYWMYGKCGIRYSLSCLYGVLTIFTSPLLHVPAVRTDIEVYYK